MSLITYQETRPWARAIRDRVSTRQMPPWHIDPVGVTRFKNDMSLSQRQIETIVRWVDAGAPEGDPRDLPPAKPLDTSNDWRAEKDGYGPPDLVIRSAPVTMPAVHQDVWFRPVSAHSDHRTAMGQGRRNEAVHAARTQDCPSRHRLS